MPTYEYICLKCQEKTEVFASIAQKEKGLKVSCPKCGGEKMIQFFGSLNLVGSSKGAGGGATYCGPQSGPGCC